MELRADGIVLRPWREDDARWVYAACRDRELQRWLPGLPGPYTHDDARAFVTDALGLGPYQFAIIGRTVDRGHAGEPLVVFDLALRSSRREVARPLLKNACRHHARSSRVARDAAGRRTWTVLLFDEPPPPSARAAIGSSRQ